MRNLTIAVAFALVSSIASVGAQERFSDRFVREFNCDRFVEQLSGPFGRHKDNKDVLAVVSLHCSVAKGRLRDGFKNVGLARLHMADHSRDLGRADWEEYWLLAAIRWSEQNPDFFIFRSVAADAQVRLGLTQESYSHGSEKALEYFQDAAQVGNRIAAYKLAQRYRDGRNIRRDYAYAYAWFNLAAKWTGDKWGLDARKALDELESKMAPAQVQEAQRITREIEQQIKMNIEKYPKKMPW